MQNKKGVRGSIPLLRLRVSHLKAAATLNFFFDVDLDFGGDVAEHFDGDWEFAERRSDRRNWIWRLST